MTNHAKPVDIPPAATLSRRAGLRGAVGLGAAIVGVEALSLGAIFLSPQVPIMISLAISLKGQTRAYFAFRYI